MKFVVFLRIIWQCFIFFVSLPQNLSKIEYMANKFDLMFELKKGSYVVLSTILPKIRWRLDY